MSQKGKVMLAMQVIANAEDAEEGERLFAEHAKFMERTHHQSGEFEMLSYNVACSPEFEDPLVQDLVPTGRKIFLMVEIYDSEAGVAEHWRIGKREWPEFGEMMAWIEKGDLTILHGSKIIHSLW